MRPYHLAVASQQFRGNEGRLNRRFIQSLHALYGPAFVRKNFKQIFDFAVSLGDNRPHHPDAILFVMFTAQHQDLGQQVSSMAESNYRSDRRNLLVEYRAGQYRAGSAGCPSMVGGYFQTTLSGQFQTARSGQHNRMTIPSGHLRTQEDFEWGHDQILLEDDQMLYGDVWARKTPPSRAAEATI